MRQPSPSNNPEFFAGRTPGPGKELEEAKIEAGVSSELAYLERSFIEAFERHDQKHLEAIIPRLEQTYSRHLADLQTELTATSPDGERQKINKEIQSLLNRQLDFEIKSGKPGVEQKRKKLERSLPYLFVGEPEDLVAEVENIKTLKFPINYPKAYGDWRERRSWAAGQLYKIQGVELDANFLEAEAVLTDPGYKGSKIEQLDKLNRSYKNLFDNLQKLLANGENYVAVRTITAMRSLADRRQNLIKESLSPLELQQKTVSAAEIVKTAETATAMSYRFSQLRYMLPFIKDQIPVDGIFADRLSLKTWAETVKAQYKYGGAFSKKYSDSTMSTDGFEVFEQELLGLVADDHSDEISTDEQQSPPTQKKRGRPPKKR